MFRPCSNAWIASSIAAENVKPERRGGLEKRARRQDLNLDGRDFTRVHGQSLTMRVQRPARTAAFEMSSDALSRVLRQDGRAGRILLGPSCAAAPVKDRAGNEHFQGSRQDPFTE